MELIARKIEYGNVVTVTFSRSEMAENAIYQGNNPSEWAKLTAIDMIKPFINTYCTDVRLEDAILRHKSDIPTFPARQFNGIYDANSLWKFNECRITLSVVHGLLADVEFEPLGKVSA